LIHAVRENRICVTQNARDFENLANLIMLCGGSHPGIFTIRNDNDRRRDMKPAQIVTAINNIAGILVSLRNLVICLNEWR
jgi:hypothetical protein